MADLRVFISAPTFDGRPTANATLPNASDGQRGISPAEARSALEPVDRFIAEHQGIQENQIQLRVEGVRTTVAYLRRHAAPAATVPNVAPAPTPAPPTPPAQEIVNMNPETVTGTGNTPPTPPVTPNNLSTEAPRVNLPAPSGPTVNPNGVNFRVSVAPATIRGLEGATLWNTTAILNFNRILTLGSAGSLRLNLGVGGILNQGDGNLLASNGGPAASVGLEAELGRPGTFSALLGFNGLAALLFGRSEVPGQAYWTGLDQGGTVGLQGCVGVRVYVSRGTSIDACWTPTIIHTPNGVRDVAGNGEHLTATGLLSFGLGVTHHPVQEQTITNGQEVCDSGETPARIRNEINELRTALLGDNDPNGVEGLREENGRLRDMVRANLEGMHLSNSELLTFARQGYARYLETRANSPITDAAARTAQAQAEYPDGTDFANPAAIIPNDIPNPLNAEHCSTDLIDLRNRLQRERNDLERQNGKLEGILIGLLIQRGIPASTAPAVLQTMTLLDFPSINFIQGAPHASGTAAQTREHQTALTYLAGFNSPAVPSGVTGNPPPANTMDDTTRTRYAEAIRARAQQLANSPTLRSILGNPTADGRFIANIANILLGYELPNTVGSNNREGIRQVLMQMPVLLESHASMEGAANVADARTHHLRHAETNNNLALTQRRAEFMVAFLKALGIPENRLRGEGYGENRPLIDETGLSGRPLLYAQARNRRTRIMADISRMDPTTGRVNAPLPPTGDAAVSGDASVTDANPASADASTQQDTSVPDV